MRVKQSTRRRGTRPTPGPKCREPGTESRGWCGKKAGRECVAAEMHCADSRSARLTAASTPECEDHFTQRKPMHAGCMNGKPPPANPCSKILCKSCRRFTTSRAPNKKTVYTPGLDPSGSTHRRLHNIARSTSGTGKSGGPAHGPWHGPPAPARKSKSTVRRGARGRRIFYAVAGAVACSVQSRRVVHMS